MTRPYLCFIGNSHLSALKQAWDDQAETARSCRSIFFGAVGSRFETLRIESGSLVTPNEEATVTMKRTSGGLDSINPVEYDAFVLAGLGFSFQIVAQMLRKSGLFDSSNHQEIAHLISYSCLQTGIYDYLERSVASHVAQLLRQLTTKPILMIQEPFPSEAALQLAPCRTLAQLSPDVLERVTRLFLTMGDAVCLKHNLQRLTQNPATCSLPCCTAPRFTRGAQKKEIRLNRDQSDDYDDTNYRHMNREFGAIVLADALAALNVPEFVL